MVLSKVFNDTIKNLSCSEIVHPGQTCWEAAFWNVNNTLFTCGQLFFPLIFLPELRKLENIKLPELYVAVKDFSAMAFTAYFGSALSMSLICSFRKLLGAFYPTTLFAIPVTIGGSLIFLAPIHTGQTFAHSAFLVMIEAFIRRGHTFYWRLIRNSNFIRTIIFMVCSFVMMDPVRTEYRHLIWFMQPLKRKPNLEMDQNKNVIKSLVLDQLIACDERVCLHSGNCDNYILEGIKKYSKFAIGLEVARVIFSHFNQLRVCPGKIIEILGANIKGSLIGFLIAYPSIYRIANCLLNRTFVQNSEFIDNLSGFIAGIAFYLYPDLPFLSLGMSSVLHLLWMKYFRIEHNRNKILAQINKLPIPQLFYTFGIGYLFHIRTFWPSTSSKFFNKVYRLTSNGKAESIQSRLVAKWLG